MLVRLPVFNILIFSTFHRVLERSKNIRLVMFLTFVRILQLVYAKGAVNFISLIFLRTLAV